MFKQGLILRERCIDSIRPFMDVPIIKIIAGVRRAGKSYVLDMIADALLSRGIPADRILYRLYTDVEVDAGFDCKQMVAELRARMTGPGKYYLLLDEVQEILAWEKGVNTLFETCDADIYITGSNSKLTAEHISSYLSGRYVLIPVYTLSYTEYLTFRGTASSDEAYREYKQVGGFPVLAAAGISGQSAYQIADGIYHSVIAKDILKNHQIRDIEKFNRVVKFIMDNMSRTFSANSVSDYLKSQHREISAETVYNYIEWLKEAFIIYPCERFDVKGKEVLKTQEKYYLSDVALRYAQFGYNRTMDDAILENIIFLELKRRGYEVFVGKIGDKEIDFIARRRGEEIQIQATVQLPLGSDREIANLQMMKDFHHKYVVTENRSDVQTIDGIRVVHAADFLRMEEW